MRPSGIGCAVLFAVLAACGGEPTANETTASEPAAAAAAPAPVAIDPEQWATPLVAVPQLTYRPALRGPDDPLAVEVPGFRIEERAVTNAQFAAFVAANPRWRRSRVARLFADAAYLGGWRDDLSPADGSADAPVTNVSWFAARAYARWLGRRLPTVAEWEAVAAASETAADGSQDPRFSARILEWYGRPTEPAARAAGSGFVNVHGVRDLHGLIWEWVEDFNTALVTGESRADTGLERNLFCGAGSVGAADPADYAAFMRLAFRSSLSGAYTVKNLGFRCAADAAPAACCAESEEPDAPLPEGSIYRLDAPWRDQRGVEQRLADLRGRTTVLAMMFTHCAYACPRIVADMHAIEAGLAAAARDATRFVLVSFDSERDTPEVLAAYAREHDLDPRRWTLLHGASADVRTLAAVLGVKFKKLAGGDYSHSNLITVIDSDGRVAHRQEGLNAATAPTLEVIRRLAE